MVGTNVPSPLRKCLVCLCVNTTRAVPALCACSHRQRHFSQGSKSLFPRSEPLISCCMRALVGEDVSHVEPGTTAACFVPGEWSIQRAEPHGPPQEAWSPPRCRYRRISSSLQLPFSSLRILKRPAYSTMIFMKVSLLE
jgi:hypothetical protein